MKTTLCSSCAVSSTCGVRAAASEPIQISSVKKPGELTIALAGNPNTGKSTVFNALTGLHQHTGNWPGKTVARAEGTFDYNDHTYRLVDLPGTYSLMASSVDEEIARDFLLFGKPDVAVIVVDSTRLERNLNLVLQVLEITDRAVLCLNLIDEAERHSIQIDCQELSQRLGIPVVPASARFNRGIDELLKAVECVATAELPEGPKGGYIDGDEIPPAVTQLESEIRKQYPELPNVRWVALRLLDGDSRMMQAVRDGELGALLAATHAEVETASASPAVSPDGAETLLQSASALRWDVGPGFHERLVEIIYARAAAIADACVTRDRANAATRWDRRLDWLFTGRWTGFPMMVVMLIGVLWLTIIGTNYPSSALAWLFVDTLHPILKSMASAIGLPWWLDGLLIDGIYLSTTWVVSVMLPPMMIFFPLFTLLEDFGYLPRVAFNLDSLFRRCGAHGKQALTMTMGLGCNAAGVVAARIIDSPRERLIAIITNNFSLCNGRWPTQILIATIFIGAMVPTYLAGLISALSVLAIALLGVAFTFLVSWGLSKTVLRGEPSMFSLELPPYRPPRLLQTLYTSLIDRTLFVLWRAVVFAVPAGAVIWLVSNIPVGHLTLAEYLIQLFEPFGLLIGLNGVILLAYIVAIPANEIVIPTILMLSVLVAHLSGVGEQGAGVMFEVDDVHVTKSILEAGGWTLLTAINLMLFSLLHNPCSTTIYTIWKETRSWKWTVASVAIPLVLGFGVCFTVAQIWHAVIS